MSERVEIPGHAEAEMVHAPFQSLLLTGRLPRALAADDEGGVAHGDEDLSRAAALV